MRAAAALAAFLLAAPAVAQDAPVPRPSPEAKPPRPAARIPCYPFKAFDKAVRKKFGEMRTGGGVRMDGESVLILYTSQTGSWSVVRLLRMDGKLMACLLDAGTGWEMLDPPGVDA